METWVLCCKLYPEQHRVRDYRLARPSPRGGWNLSATAGLDRWLLKQNPAYRPDRNAKHPQPMAGGVVNHMEGFSWISRQKRLVFPLYRSFPGPNSKLVLAVFYFAGTLPAPFRTLWSIRTPAKRLAWETILIPCSSQLTQERVPSSRPA